MKSVLVKQGWTLLCDYYQEHNLCPRGSECKGLCSAVYYRVLPRRPSQIKVC